MDKDTLLLGVILYDGKLNFGDTYLSFPEYLHDDSFNEIHLHFSDLYNNDLMEETQFNEETDLDEAIEEDGEFFVEDIEEEKDEEEDEEEEDAIDDEVDEFEENLDEEEEEDR